MCQLTGRPTEYKYRSSYERIGRAILRYSSVPKMDIINFFEVVLFSWLTGNNDMHLKNFSLYEPKEGVIRLSPAYDLLNATIANPKDDEELALTLNGKKKKINRQDFYKFAESIGIGSTFVDKLIKKYERLLPKLFAVVKESFVDTFLAEECIEVILKRISKLNQ